MEGRTLTPSRAPQRATSGLGNRLRQLRVAAGLTQSELASDRFSKEYVSQIERGKTRPTQETLAWIAERLGVDVSYLETGQSWDEYAEAEAAVVRAEAAVEGQRFDEALEALAGLQYSPEAQELEFRARLAEGWARMNLGELRPALDLLARARELSEQDSFSDVERADVLYHMGVCRYKLTSINTAQTLLSEALDLADRSGLPCDRLRSHVLEWRSRCSRRQRDFAAAREDIERALELAERIDDTEARAHALNTIGTTELLAGNPAGRAKLEQSLELGREFASPDLVGRAFIHFLQVGAHRRAYELADGYFEPGVAYLGERGLDLWRSYLFAFRAKITLDRGQWDEAAELATLVFQKRVISTFPRIVASVVLGLVRARRGEPDASSPLDDAFALAKPTG